MIRDPQQILVSLARYGALAIAAVNVAVVLVLMCYRVPYPFEIEWIEGAMVDQVRRILAGQRIYVAPSTEFVPFLYPPGFFYLSALLTQIVGEGFLGLRLVSALSSVGVLGLIALFVWRETGVRHLGVVAAGLFAATYRIGGTFFDIGRVDMLLLFLLLGSFFAIRFGSRTRTYTVAGLLLAAAFLTKQTAVVMAAPVVLWLLLVRPRKGLVVALVAGITALVATLWLDHVHEGWYRYFVFDMPSSYPVRGRRLVEFWTHDIIPKMSVALSIGLFYLLTPAAGSMRGFYLSAAIGLITGAWLSRGNVGGYDNVLIPAFAALSLLSGLGLHTLRRWLDAAAPARGGAPAWPYLLVAVQFAVLLYNPLDQQPHHGSVEAGRHLVQLLESANGAVWVPYHGYLPAVAGKPTQAHWMAVSDILNYGRPDLRARLRTEIERAISERRFALIVLSSRPFSDFPSLDASYELRGPVFNDEGVFWPLTGSPRRPENIYVPK